LPDCDYSQNVVEAQRRSQHLGNISKRLSPDFFISDAFKLQSITVQQNKTGISKVKMMLFKVYKPLKPQARFDEGGQGETCSLLYRFILLTRLESGIFTRLFRFCLVLWVEPMSFCLII